MNPQTNPNPTTPDRDSAFRIPHSAFPPPPSDLLTSPPGNCLILPDGEEHECRATEPQSGRATGPRPGRLANVPVPRPSSLVPPAVQGWVPELHAVIAEHGIFTIVHSDGSQRTFANLAIAGTVHHAVLAFFDPGNEDEVQVFDCWRSRSPRLTQIDQKEWRGSGLLLCHISASGEVHTVFIAPADLTADEWAPASTAPLYMTCYFRDAMGRLALGYREDRPAGPKPWSYVSLSGPADLVPAQWHRAHAAPVMEDILKGGAA